MHGLTIAIAPILFIFTRTWLAWSGFCKNNSCIALILYTYMLRCWELRSCFWCLIGNKIIVAPVGKTVLLGTSPEFYCTTFGSIPQWVINGSELDLTQSSIHRENGIIRCSFQQISGRLYKSTLCVEAKKANNNTEIRCVVSGSDVQSQPVIMRIQGS